MKLPSEEINDLYSESFVKARLMSRNKPVNRTALRIFCIEEWLNRKFGEDEKKDPEEDKVLEVLPG